MDDVEAFTYDPGKLSEMGLVAEVLDIFKEAETRILKARKSNDLDEIRDIRKYVGQQQERLLSTGSYEKSDLDEQFGKGILYLGHVALTGKIS